MITLYNKDTTNRIRIWEIEVEGSTYKTRDGIEGGKIKDWVSVACIAKNIGKSNQTTPESQAELEAENLINKKIKDGYFKTREEALQDNSFSKMLAHPLEKYPQNAKFPYWMSRKLDGVACNPINGELVSRNGRPFTSAPHIIKALEEFQSRYPGVVLCGELYSHKYKDKFDELISIIRKQKPSEEDLLRSENELEYHIYDIYDPQFPDYSVLERQQILGNLFNSFFKDKSCIVFEESELVNNQEEADTFHMNAIVNGYEGTMIRTSQCLYEPGKRSSHLLKRKDFITEEYEIVDVIEGNGQWQGKAKEVQVKVKDKITGCGIRGSFEFCEDLLINKNKYIKQKATVRHFGETKDGLLRFGVVIAIRNYE